MNDIIFNVTYKGKTYAYKSGAQAHIFHCGVYAEIDEKYGIDTLLQYVGLVYDCYLSDSNNTNVTELADHIAKHWEQLKDSERFEILEKYYRGCVQ